MSQVQAGNTLSDSSPIRVLHIIDSLEMGGAERSLLELTARMDRAKVKPIVCSIYDGSQLADQFRAAGVDIHQLEIRAKYGPLRCVRKIARLINAENIDLVHTSLFRASQVGCGTGLSLQFISQQPDLRLRLHGMDISEVMLAQARKKFVESTGRCELVSGSAFDLPFDDNTMDILYNTRFLHQFTLPEQHEIHSEFRRVVKPGGIIVSEFYGGRRGRNREHQRHQEEYPARSEVSRIVGGDFMKIPISSRGEQLLCRIAGAQVTSVVNKLLRKLPFNPLVHEYFAVVQC